MKIVQISVFLLLVILLIQCGADQRAEDPQPPKKIEVNYISEIKLSELVEPGCEYLPLQTDQTPIIGYVDKLVSTDSAYYILDVRFSKNLMIARIV